MQNNLQKLQNRAGRIITNSDYSVISADVLKILDWKTLKRRRFEQMVTLIFKSLNNMAPSSGNHFTLHCNETYNLRSNNNRLTLSKPKTSSMKKSFSYYGAKVWNYLPTDLNSSMSLCNFKKQLSTFLDVNINVLDEF